jgi:hypothetical protein
MADLSLFFKTEEDLKIYLNGEFPFPELDSEKSRDFLQKLSEELSKHKESFETKKDIVVGTKEFFNKMHESLHNLLKRHRPPKECTLINTKKGILPFHVNLSLGKRESTLANVFKYLIETNFKPLRSNISDKSKIILELVFNVAESYLFTFNKNIYLWELINFGLNAAVKRVMKELEFDEEKSKKYIFDLSKKNSHKIEETLEEVTVINKNRFKLKNSEFYEYNFNRKGKIEQNNEFLEFNTDINYITYFEEWLSKKADLKLNDYKDLEADLSVTRRNLTVYERSQIENSAEECSKIQNYFIQHNSSIFLKKYSNIMQELNYFCSFKNFKNKKEIAISSCGYDDVLLIVLPGVSFAYGGYRRTYFVLSQLGESVDLGKKSEVIIIGNKSWVLNGPLTIDKLQSVHLENSYDIMRDYTVSSLLNSNELLTVEDEFYYFGTRPLICLVNDKTLSDFLINERYISLGLTSRRCEISKLIDSMSLPLRKPIYLHFFNRFLNQVRNFLTRLRIKKPEAKLSDLGEVEFDIKQSIIKSVRIFSRGYYKDYDEFIQGMYLGYLVSKERVDHFHHLMKALEKMFESIDEFNESIVDLDFRDVLFGYSDLTFDIDKELKIAVSIFTKFKDKKFLSSRWLNFLSGSLLIKENLIESSQIINSLNFEEFFEPPYRLATNKSSLDKPITQKEDDILEMIKNVYIDEALTTKKRKKRLIKLLRERDKFKNLDDLTINELTSLKSERKKTTLSLVNLIEKKLLFNSNIEEIGEKDKNEFEIKESEELGKSKEEKKEKKLEDLEAPTLLEIVKTLVGKKDFLFYIDFFDKEQFAGDREISILNKEGRDALRIVECFFEQVSKFIPFELISNKDKFIYQSHTYSRTVYDTLKTGGVYEFWNQDKSRWGPTLMPTHFSDLLYSFKKIIATSLGDDFFKLFITILNKFHLKRGLIPSVFLNSWLKPKNLMKKSKSLVLENIKNVFLDRGEMYFKIIPGMMQGLLQQTSTVLAAAKVSLSNYFIRIKQKSYNLRCIIRDGVTSDDSMKALAVIPSNKDIDILKFEDKKLEFAKLAKDFLIDIQFLDKNVGLMLGMYDNTKKTVYHSFILEINQNFIAFFKESGNPFKMYGLSRVHLPSISWHENISYGFSNIQNIARSGVTLNTIFYLSKTFREFMNKKYSIENFDFKKFDLLQGEIPSNLIGFPELCPTDILYFGSRVNNYRLFRASSKFIKPLIVMMDFYGNKSYFDSIDYELDKLTSDVSIKFSTRKLNVTWRIRNFIRKNFNFSFDKLNEIKRNSPLSLLLKSNKYIDFKSFVLQKYFSEGVEDMFIQKSDVLNHLRLASIKNNKTCYYKEFEDLTEEELKERNKNNSNNEEKNEKKDNVDEIYKEENLLEIENELEKEFISTKDKRKKPIMRNFFELVELILTKCNEIKDTELNKLIYRRRIELDLDNIMYKRSSDYYESVNDFTKVKKFFPITKRSITKFKYNIYKYKQRNDTLTVVLTKWFKDILKENRFILKVNNVDKLDSDFIFLKGRFKWLDENFDKFFEKNFSKKIKKDSFYLYDIIKTVISTLDRFSDFEMNFYAPSNYQDLYYALENTAKRTTSNKFDLVFSLDKEKYHRALYTEYRQNVRLGNLDTGDILSLIRDLSIIYELLNDFNKDQDFKDFCNESYFKGEKIINIIKSLNSESCSWEDMNFYDISRFLCIKAKLLNNYDFIDLVYKKRAPAFSFFIKPQKKFGNIYNIFSSFTIFLSERMNTALFTHVENSFSYFTLNKFSDDFIISSLNKITEIMISKEGGIGDENLIKYYDFPLFFPYFLDYKRAIELFQNESFSGFIEVDKNNKVYIRKKPINKDNFYIPYFEENVKRTLFENEEQYFYQKEGSLTVFTKYPRKLKFTEIMVEKVVVSSYSFFLKISNLINTSRDYISKFGFMIEDYPKLFLSVSSRTLKFDFIPEDIVIMESFKNLHSRIFSRIGEVKEKMEFALSKEKLETKIKKYYDIFLDKLKLEDFKSLLVINIIKTTSGKDLFKEIASLDLLEPFEEKNVNKDVSILEKDENKIREYEEDPMLIALAKKTLTNKNKYFSKRNISVKEDSEKKEKSSKVETNEDIIEEDEDDEELEKFVLSIQREELTDPLIRNTLTDTELSQLIRLKEEEIKIPKGYKKVSIEKEKIDIKKEQKYDEQGNDNKEDEYVPRKLTKEEEEIIEKMVEEDDSGPVTFDDDELIQDLSDQLEGIDEEKYLMSMSTILESEFLSAVNVPKDILGKINLVRKGGLNWFIPKKLLEQVEFSIKRDLRLISVSDASFILDSLFENLKEIERDDFFKPTMKCIYFEKRFFKLRLKDFIRKNIKKVLRVLYEILIYSYIFINIPIKGAPTNSRKKILSYLRKINLKYFLNNATDKDASIDEIEF